jgi:hypothetical protein
MGSVTTRFGAAMLQPATAVALVPAGFTTWLLAKLNAGFNDKTGTTAEAVGLLGMLRLRLKGAVLDPRGFKICESCRIMGKQRTADLVEVFLFTKKTNPFQ